MISKKHIGFIALAVGVLIKAKAALIGLILFTPIEELAMAKVFHVPLSCTLILSGLILLAMHYGGKNGR